MIVLASKPAIRQVLGAAAAAGFNLVAFGGAIGMGRSAIQKPRSIFRNYGPPLMK